MALDKQTISIPFVEGLDTKTNPWLVKPGRMLELSNTVFTTAGELKKRNGFSLLTEIPSNASITTLSTHKGNLTAIGTRLLSYGQESNLWIDKGPIQTLQLSTQTAVRTANSQSACDVAINSLGLACFVYLDSTGVYKYQINDSATSQVLVAAVSLPSTASQARVFALPHYFVITFFATVTGTPHLRYIAIPYNNITAPGAATDLSTQVSGLSAGYDGFVANNTLYIAWDGSDIGGAIRVTYLSSALSQGTTVALTGHTASLMSVTADTSSNTAVIWVTAYASNNAYTYALSQILVTIMTAKHSITSETCVEITSTADNGVLNLFYEKSNTYSYNSVRTDLLRKNTVTQSGTVGSPTTILRGVGINSKAFLYNNISYLLCSFGEAFQPTYFLVNDSGSVVGRLAATNGGGYATTQVLSNVSQSGNAFSMAYLYKDFLVPVSKDINADAPGGIYSQTGINLATFDFSAMNLNTVEIGGSLLIAGGMVWQYDGVKPVELGFHVWPESIVVTTSGSGGHLADQQYFYVAVYEWTDAQGNIHRSAPSVPYSITTSGGNNSTNTINIPTLRLTYKVDPNKVRLVVYRWSQAQQVFYQISSISSPTLNDTTVDSVAVTDTVADSGILGNNILYTTGGVVENICPPAPKALALFKSRLFLINAEDQDQLWYSKQVIESTPVEMSDLFTEFVAPTTGAQASTGSCTALAPMDDKLIVFKRSACYYIVGTGPDNTGNNNDFQDPVFIMGTVGTAFQESICYLPNGMVFDASNGGRWLLRRDLGTEYLGAPVEAFNSFSTVSSVTIKDQTQIRLSLSNGDVLMYDYFYGQWGTFEGIPNISSCVYNGQHTFLNNNNEVYQEAPGTYVDGSRPVLMKFTSAWMSLAGVQGLERAYWFYLLGKYFSPHKINLSISYDYNESPSQTIVITPDNYASPYGQVDGDVPYYGQGPAFGGPGNVEQWRVFLNRQKVQTFRITFEEVFDPSLGTAPGAGLSLTGLDLTVGLKRKYATLKPSRSAG